MAKLVNQPPKPRKLFLGAKLRQVRSERGISQAAFAEELQISPSYMNQLEHDQRPLSATVLLQLASVTGMDIAQLTEDPTDKLVDELQSNLNDPAFGELEMSPSLIRHLVSVAPEMARAALIGYDLAKQTEEKLNTISARLDLHDVEASSSSAGVDPLPYDEVRDFFHHHDNYIDALDRAAEHLSEREGLFGPERFDRLIAHIKRQHGIEVQLLPSVTDAEVMFEFDETRGILHLGNTMSRATQSFQLAGVIARLELAQHLDAAVIGARMHSEAATQISNLALINYSAGALVFPYRTFAQTAQEFGHDVERLQQAFGASFEQVSHRLSTLQRPGAKGIPFYFVRVDRAGNITKRHSATKLRFARFGGACPLWNIHEAFAMPGRIFVQVAEMPEGTRYLSIARSIIKRSGRFDGFDRHYAVGLGCELKDAKSIVYAQGIDVSQPGAVTPIGISCRTCDHQECPQRAFPPVGKEIAVNPNNRRIVPFTIS